MIDPQSLPHLPGISVLDVDGDIIGSVDRVYIHQDAGEPLWVGIHTNFEGTPNVFAPLDNARFDDQPGSALHVGLPRATVEDAPVISSTETLTVEDLHALRGYYRNAPRETASAALSTTFERENDVADVDLVRSEERLRVSTVSVPKEQIRFEKVIVTEEKTITVTVRREELRSLRGPVSGASPLAPSTGPTETPDLVIVLHEEQVEVTTRVVPVERVRIRVTQVTEDRHVTDTLRKERVKIDTTAP